MAVITTGAHPKALWPGVHKFFGAVYNKHPAEYRSLFDIRPSNKNYEEMVSTYGFGLAPIKTEGGSTTYTSHAQNWVERFVHVAYSLGFIVTKEEIADNLYSDKAFDRAGHLAFSFSQTIENVAANVYKIAVSTTPIWAATARNFLPPTTRMPWAGPTPMSFPPGRTCPKPRWRTLSFRSVRQRTISA